MGTAEASAESTKPGTWVVIETTRDGGVSIAIQVRGDREIPSFVLTRPEAEMVSAKLSEFLSDPKAYRIVDFQESEQ